MIPHFLLLLLAGAPPCPSSPTSWADVDAPGDVVAMHGSSTPAVVTRDGDTHVVWRRGSGERAVNGWVQVLQSADAPRDVAVDDAGNVAVLQAQGHIKVFPVGSLDPISVDVPASDDIATQATGFWLSLSVPADTTRTLTWVPMRGLPVEAGHHDANVRGLAAHAQHAYFTVDNDGKRDVWRRVVSGEAPATQITQKGGWAPAVSPGGSWVAFVSDRTGGPAAWALHVDDGRLVQLSKEQPGLQGLAWDPADTGRRLVGLVDDGDGKRLRVLDGVGLGVETCAPSVSDDTAARPEPSVTDATNREPSAPPATTSPSETPAEKASAKASPDDAAPVVAEDTHRLGLLPDWFAVQVGLAASTKNIGFGFRLRYAGVAQTNVATDYLTSSFLNGLWVDDVDAFRVNAAQLFGFRMTPWPFEFKWLHDEKTAGPWPDIAMGIGAWTTVEVDHALQFFRMGDAGVFAAASVGAFVTFAFSDVSLSLQYRPFGLTAYWIDGTMDATPFNLQNPILDVNVTYTFPL